MERQSQRKNLPLTPAIRRDPFPGRMSGVGRNRHFQFPSQQFPGQAPIVTSRSPGQARSSPQQGCCHGHYKMTTRRCRPADSFLRLYRPSGYYRPCRPFSLIHALLVTF
ncbi:hypothetical protein T03_2919 [Trichinella britovi]|uniref:Uncharacterized protein n=1 Tax=Trichinella britovi TaxID=45882 RepID=A0A0V1DJF2_TRIBR|nr:hypothetical protein T03_2919 [Trichinella britovi]